MWHHPATQTNMQTLKDRGVIVVEPEAGRLASGAAGDGRLATIEGIVFRTRCVLGQGGALAGKKIVVTAGGTREAIDPVRFIGNSSSGTMGIAIALAAADRGAEVTLIVGPTVASTPIGMNVIRISSALE